MYEMCSLLPPFLAGNQKMLALKIKDGHFKPIPAHYSSDMQKIIKLMLTVDVRFQCIFTEIASSKMLGFSFFPSLRGHRLKIDELEPILL